MTTILSDTEMLEAVETLRDVIDVERRAPSRLIPLLVASALGVLLVAIAYAAGRAGDGWAPAVFWAGMIVVVAPIAYRLLGAEASYGERLGLALILGMAFYAVMIMYSPTGFQLHDELGQLRSTENLLSSGKLYTQNPIVASYAYFPGLHAVTAALASISGVSIFTAGVIVIGVGRAILMVTIFALLERLTGSARIAGIGTLIYAANPNFLIFDAQYSYESLAVPLAAATLLTTAWAARREAGRPLAVVLALLLGGAVVVTHHMTSYALVAALVVWAVFATVRNPRHERGGAVAFIAAAVAAMAAAWLLVAGHAINHELGPVATEAAESLWNLISGSAGAKAPFTAAQGYSDPLYIKVMGIASVALLLVALPWALYATGRRRGRHPALSMLALAALIYPATLVLRLTAAGTETSNRASEFVFLGLGATIGVCFLRWLAVPIDSGAARVRVRLAATAVACVVVLGGITVGQSSTTLLPGSYVVGADARSITAEGVAAARWARKTLPPEGRMLADGGNKGLMAAIGLQDPQGGSALGEPLGAIVTSPVLSPRVEAMIAYDKIEYVVVDMRLTRDLPRSGHYFDGGDPGPYTRPLEGRALRKFSRTGQLDKIYTSGNIRVFKVVGAGS
jgi:hypothetical protein